MPELYEEKIAKASAAQRRAKLGAVEAILWGGKPKAGKQWKLKGFIKRHIAFQVVRFLDIRLRDISLHITVDRGLRLCADSQGTPKLTNSKSSPGETYTASLTSMNT